MDSALIQGLLKTIDDLKNDVDLLKKKRIYQQDVIPQSIKNRHMGEANTYIPDDLVANLPTTGASVTIGTQNLYTYDTKRLYIWNRSTSTWNYVAFT